MKNFIWLVVLALSPITVSAHGEHGNTANSMIHSVLHSQSLPFIALGLMVTLGVVGVIHVALKRKNITAAKNS